MTEKSEKSGWLIERYYNGALYYWSGRPRDSAWTVGKDATDIDTGAWTDKHEDAIWFLDQSSAAVVLSWALGGVGRTAQHIVIQTEARP